MTLASGSTRQALAEKLFHCAIESGDTEVADYLLKNRYVNVDQEIFVDNGRRLTPAEWSSWAQNVGMTRLLVTTYDADVSKTYDISSHKNHGALQSALRAYDFNDRNNPFRANLELVQVLIGSGAEIDTRSIDMVIQRQYVEVAQFLIQEGAELHHTEWIAKGIILDAVLLLGVEVATFIFMILRELKSDINLIHGDDDWRRSNNRGQLERATLLDAAAQKGYLTLVKQARSDGALFTETSLTYAIQSQNLELVKYIIREGGSIENHYTYNGPKRVTMLSEAIRSRNLEIFQYLAANGALSNIRSEFHFEHAVCAAAEVGNLMVLKLLITRKPDRYREAFRKGLSSALREAQEEAALLLFDVGATPYATDFSCLSDSLKNNMKQIFYRLLNTNIRPYNSFPADANYPLLVAIKQGDMDVMKDLIFAGALQASAQDYGEKFNNPIYLAAKKRDPRIVQLLLDSGARFGYFGESALSAAAEQGNIEVVRILLDEGADPCDEIALMRASSEGNGILDTLLQAFVEKYPRGRKGYGCLVIAKAMRERNDALLDTVLQANPYFDCLYYDTSNLKRSVWRTPLSVAIQGCNFQAVKRLLDLEVDLNKVVLDTLSSIDSSPIRQTPLLLATRLGGCAMVQLLIDNGANINLPAKLGISRTPLQMAAQVGNLALCQLLLRNGAEVNGGICYDGGGTAIQLAAIGGYIGVLEELLKWGGDLNAPPAKRNGRTTIEGAIEHGRLDMVKYLLDAGAKMGRPGHPEFEEALKRAEYNGHRAVCGMVREYFSEDGRFISRPWL